MDPHENYVTLYFERSRKRTEALVVHRAHDSEDLHQNPTLLEALYVNVCEESAPEIKYKDEVLKSQAESFLFVLH